MVPCLKPRHLPLGCISSVMELIWGFIPPFRRRMQRMHMQRRPAMHSRQQATRLSRPQHKPLISALWPTVVFQTSAICNLLTNSMAILFLGDGPAISRASVCPRQSQPPRALQCADRSALITILIHTYSILTALVTHTACLTSIAQACSLSQPRLWRQRGGPQPSPTPHRAPRPAHCTGLQRTTPQTTTCLRSGRLTGKQPCPGALLAPQAAGCLLVAVLRLCTCGSHQRGAANMLPSMASQGPQPPKFQRGPPGRAA